MRGRSVPPTPADRRRQPVARGLRVGLSALLCLLTTATGARAGTPGELLEVYRTAAATSPDFRGFSGERGRVFFHAVRRRPDGDIACASCHGADPRETVFGHGGDMRARCSACHLEPTAGRPQRPGVRQQILPLAPVANPDRFTDADHAELWFDVNCFLVLGRPCTVREKGDVLQYLIELR